MNEKDLSEFPEFTEINEEMKKEERVEGERSGQCSDKEVKIYNKRGKRSSSFVRNWGGWEKAGGE